MIVTGQSEFGRALAQALDLPRHVRSITLRVSYDDEAVTARVTFLVTKSQAKRVLETVKHYELHERVAR